MPATKTAPRRAGRLVIGPSGSVLTPSDLPPVDTVRWTPRKKAEVVAAVRGGLLGLSEACDRYKLDVDEFMSWQEGVDRHGLDGLRVTKLQHYSGRRSVDEDPIIGRTVEAVDDSATSAE